MKSFFKIAIAFLVVALATIGTSQATTISLGTASDFAVLGGSGVTNTGTSTFIGDVGSWPTSAIVGITAPMVNGTLYMPADPATNLAHTDLIDAFTAAMSVTGGMTGPTDLGGANLNPGVYTYAAAAPWAAGTLTLDALGDSNAQWIFQIGSTLITPGGAAVSLINGASANNVFWLVGSSATIGGTNTFAGNILANTSISLGGGTLDGRALAIDGAVTIGAQQIVTSVPEPITICLLAQGALYLMLKKK